jgi:hypothetical protein
MIAEKRGDRSNQKGCVLMQIRSLIFLAALCIPSQAAVGVRVIFGLTDQAETKWDGSATARSGHIASIEPWRFEGRDALHRWSRQDQGTGTATVRSQSRVK